MIRSATQIASSRRHRSGFTLIELLVVIGIVAALAGVVIGGLGGTDRSTSLRSSQAMVMNLLALTRSKAMSSGRDTYFLVNDNSSDVSRYRRMLAVADKDDITLIYLVVLLPEGTFVVPHQDRFGSTMKKTGDSWTTLDGGSLASSALRSTVSQSIESTTSETWESFPIYAEGTTDQQGKIVVAVGHERSPADVDYSSSPIILESPDQVRGMLISNYGLARQINDRTGF